MKTTPPRGRELLPNELTTPEERTTLLADAYKIISRALMTPGSGLSGGETITFDSSSNGRPVGPTTTALLEMHEGDQEIFPEKMTGAIQSASSRLNLIEGQKSRWTTLVLPDRTVSVWRNRR